MKAAKAYHSEYSGMWRVTEIVGAHKGVGLTMTTDDAYRSEQAAREAADKFGDLPGEVSAKITDPRFIKWWEAGR